MKAVFYDLRGDAIAGEGWVNCGTYVERKKPGVPGVVERVWLGSRRPSRVRSSGNSVATRAAHEIELRNSQSPIQLTIDPDARDTIVEEVLTWASDYQDGGRESGGYVFGLQTAKRLEATCALLAGPSTERERSNMRLDSTRADVEFGTGERLLGDYHSHPNGNGRPSEADLRSWQRSAEMQDPMPHSWRLGEKVRGSWLGIIVTPAGGSWNRLNLNAWITRDLGDRVICEPAGVWR